MIIFWVLIGLVGLFAIAWFYFSFVSLGFWKHLIDELFDFCVFLGMFLVFPVVLYRMYDNFDGFTLLFISAFISALIMTLLSPLIMVFLILLELIISYLYPDD